MVEVLVEFEYEAVEDDELSLKVGDVIKNVIIQDGGWWEGDLRGKRGVFPDNFVKVLKEEKKEEKREPVQTVTELKNKLTPKQASTKNANIKRDSSTKKKLFAKARYSYTPTKDDELRLNVGDIIEVLDQEEEGWWSGVHNGHTGVFPSNFVETVAEDEKTESEAAENKEKFKEIKGKKVVGVGLGNIFQGQNIQLKPTGSKKGDDSKGSAAKKTQAEESPVLPPRPAKPILRGKAHNSIDMKSTYFGRRENDIKSDITNKPRRSSTGSSAGNPVERAKVLFSYVAENTDELTIEVGNVINILNKESEDSGWWKGEYNGKVGVFPDNFVELLPPEEPKPKKPPPVVAKSKPEDKGSKAPIPEPVKHKAEEKTVSPPPPIPSKKPDILSKKPIPSKTPPTSDVKQNENGTDDFDGIQSTEPLKSFSRPKNPNRRPPSMELLRKEGEDNNSNAQLVNDVKPTATKRDSKEEKKVQPSAPEIKPQSRGHHAEKVVNDRSAADSETIAELRKEILELRSNAVSTEDFINLKNELSAVKDQMDHMKKQLGKRIMDLMQEIDEEKKIRLSTQVEMERVKQLVMKSDSVV
ncbi:SH3 domain-containing kinase-binding protein 1-like isoform X2 [Tubulanus polymorphus]|uniref:SH3 domain-containing kinase-binding protein 1-like isoform X2 n=1 Tax=Tubulanus polymorphus TaxID=672921 RepID=UPI003DA399F5